MEHRGGCSADRDSGDGAGVMTAIPWTLIEQWAAANGRSIDRERTAVGMLFLPLDPDKLAATKAAIAQTIAHRHGGKISVSSQVRVGSCFQIRLPLCN